MTDIEKIKKTITEFKDLGADALIVEVDGQGGIKAKMKFVKTVSYPEVISDPATIKAMAMPSDDDFLLWSTNETLSFETEKKQEINSDGL